MFNRRLVSTLFILFLTTIVPTAVLAQSATGTLKGRVTDTAGASVNDVTVSVSDTGTGLTRTVTTNADGRFQLQLSPGSYRLKSLASGYTAVTVEQVIVNVGEVIRLTIPIEESAIEEIIVYGTPAPLMATATGETSLHITLEELSQLPVARSIEAVALLAPGTVPGQSWLRTGPYELISFGGASVAENAYFIDGLNVSNFRTGLGGSSVPFEFYDQFQIKTGGYSAEFGRSTGGVINAVTRRGNNEFEYGIVAYIEPDWGRSDEPDTKRPDGSYYQVNSENAESKQTTDIYLSGPIIKDRLFFFALYEPQRTNYEWANQNLSAEDFYHSHSSNNFWGGNLTWHITDNQSLSYTAFSDAFAGTEELFEFNSDDKAIGERVGEVTYLFGGNHFVVSYDAQITDQLFVSARYGRNKYNLTNFSSGDDLCPAVVDVRDSSTVFTPGCWVNGTIRDAHDERRAYRLDAEYYIGNHTIRAGLDREDNVSFDAQTYSGRSYAPGLPGGAYYRYESWDVGAQLSNGGIVPDANGDGSRVDTVRFWYWERGGAFDAKSHSWYLEDTWDLSNAVTVSLGLRNESFENFNGLGDPFFTIDDQWAPRLALEWSPGAAQDQRVTLNWGRYHLPILAFPNIELGSANLDYYSYHIDDGTRDEATAAPVAIDANGVPTTQELGTTYYYGDGSVADTRGTLDTSLEPMYQDEWMIGYERELGDNWTVGIRYINRQLRSLIEDVSTGAGLEAIGFLGETSRLQACYFVMTNPGTDITTFCDSDGDGVLEQTLIPADALGYPKARRLYEAIDLTAEANIGDRWYLRGSYTLSWNKGNTEGSVKSDNQQTGANWTTDFDFPQLMDGAYGYLPNDRRHKMKLWATYQATDRLAVAANLFAQSGRPVNTFGSDHPDGRPAHGSTYYLTQDLGDPDVQGDETFKFVPRGTEGRTGWITQLDLAAIYAFSWAENAEVELRAEVFNVLDGDSEREVYEFAEGCCGDALGLPMTYQKPRYLRFGMAVRF